MSYQPPSLGGENNNNNSPIQSSNPYAQSSDNLFTPNQPTTYQSSPPPSQQQPQQQFAPPCYLKQRVIKQYANTPLAQSTLPTAENVPLTEEQLKVGVAGVDAITELEQYLHPQSTWTDYLNWFPIRDRHPVWSILIALAGFTLLIDFIWLILSFVIGDLQFGSAVSSLITTGAILFFIYWFLFNLMPGNYATFIAQNPREKYRGLATNPFHYLFLSAARPAERLTQSFDTIRERIAQLENGQPRLQIQINCADTVHPEQQQWLWTETIEVPIVRAVDISYHQDDYFFTLQNAFTPLVGITYEQKYQLAPQQQQILLQWANQLRSYWLTKYRIVDVEVVYYTDVQFVQEELPIKYHPKLPKQFRLNSHTVDWMTPASYTTQNFHPQDPYVAQKKDLQSLVNFYGFVDSKKVFFWFYTFLYPFAYNAWKKVHTIIPYQSVKYLHISTPQHPFFAPTTQQPLHQQQPQQVDGIPANPFLNPAQQQPPATYQTYQQPQQQFAQPVMNTGEISNPFVNNQ